MELFLRFAGKKVGFQLANLVRTNVKGRNAYITTQSGKQAGDEECFYLLLGVHGIKNTFSAEQGDRGLWFQLPRRLSRESNVQISLGNIA